MLKEKYNQPKIIYPVKLFSKREGAITTFSDKNWGNSSLEKIAHSSHCMGNWENWHVLEDILKDVLQEKKNDVGKNLKYTKRENKCQRKRRNK